MPPDPKILGKPENLSPGWQYPTDDPGAAVRNYLRERGMLPNPYSQGWTRILNSFIGSIYPQFLSSLGADTQNIPSDFGNFIGGRWSGEIPAWNIPQATAGLRGLNERALGAQSRIGSYGQSLGMNIQTPADLEAARLKATEQPGLAGLSPVEIMLAGIFANPETQLRLLGGAYTPGMGPALTKSYLQGLSPAHQAWEDNLDVTLNQPPNYQTLLGLLMGTPGATGFPTSPGGVGPGVAPRPPAAMGSAQTYGGLREALGDVDVLTGGGPSVTQQVAQATMPPIGAAGTGMSPLGPGVGPSMMGGLQTGDELPQAALRARIGIPQGQFRGPDFWAMLQALIQGLRPSATPRRFVPQTPYGQR